MIKKITKPIILKYENRLLNVPEETKENIKKFWDKLVTENPNLFNGENHCVENIIEHDGFIEMKVVRTNYATYMYSEKVGLPNKDFKIIHLWSGILLETKDNYYVIGEMGETTVVPGCLQIPGGGTSDEDISGDTLDINANLKRELKEELNLDLDSIQYEMKYLEVPSEKRSVYGFLAIGRLDINKEELNKHFEEYKEYIRQNNLEQEFSKLVFLPKNNALIELDKLENQKREYLRELIEIAHKEIS